MLFFRCILDVFLSMSLETQQEFILTGFQSAFYAIERSLKGRGDVLGQQRVGQISSGSVALLNAAFDAVSRFRALPSAAVLDARRARRSRPTHDPRPVPRVRARPRRRPSRIPRRLSVTPGVQLPYPAEIRRRSVRSRRGGTPLPQNGHLARPFLFGARYRGARGGHVEPDGRRRGTSGRKLASSNVGDFTLVDISSTISEDYKFSGAAAASNGKIVFAP